MGIPKNFFSDEIFSPKHLKLIKNYVEVWLECIFPTVFHRLEAVTRIWVVNVFFRNFHTILMKKCKKTPNTSRSLSTMEDSSILLWRQQ